MNRKPEVCVLPVAGLSTRNLPTTKVLHKKAIGYAEFVISAEFCKINQLFEAGFVAGKGGNIHSFDVFIAIFCHTNLLLS